MLTLQDLLRTRTAQPQLNKAMYFNGYNAYVEVSAQLINVYKPFTVMGWFSPNDIIGDRTLFEFYGAGNSRVRFAIRNGNTAINEIFSPITYNRFLWGSVKQIYVREWHHFAAVVDPTGSTNNYQYIDGVLQFTGISDSAKWYQLRQPIKFTIAYPAYYCTWWYGLIAQVLVYSRLLSASEIIYNMSNPNNPIRDGLVLWLDARACDTSKNVCWDLSGNGNHGAMYNVQIVTLPNPVRVGGTL